MRFFRLSLVVSILSLSACQEKQAPEKNTEPDAGSFFVGTIRTEGILFNPLVEKKFLINYHFSGDQFKYEYIEGDKESGLIINYNTQEVTLYSTEYNLKKKFTTTIADFENKHDDLLFFSASVNDIFSRIIVPEYLGTKTDYGEIHDNKFNLINYGDGRGKLDICDLKISIPHYVTAITFKDKPKEVKHFPLTRNYKRKLRLWEKISLYAYEIQMNTVILALDSAENFVVPDEYEPVDDISYAASKGKSIFGTSDD